MLQNDHKYRELIFQPVNAGGICCIHRPSHGGLIALSEGQCTAVITLLSPTENPHEIGNTCKHQGMKWL